MKLIRFAVIGLTLFGVVACTIALLRLAHMAPPSKLAPYPAWTAAHFTPALVFVVLMSLQLWPGLRAARPRLHRILGRIAIGVGVVMAAGGVAMVWLVPDRPVAERIFMSVFFAAWTATLGLGFRAARARDIPSHRAWMVRMSATTLTPLTQRVIFPVFALSFGIDGTATFWQLFVSAAWVAWGINLTIAEAWLHGRTRRLAAA